LVQVVSGTALLDVGHGYHGSFSRLYGVCCNSQRKYQDRSDPLAELFTEIVPQWIFSTTQPDHITIEPDYGVTVKCLQGRLSICCSEVLILDCLDFEVSLPNVFMLL
jgi:hypothetical protein